MKRAPCLLVTSVTPIVEFISPFDLFQGVRSMLSCYTKPNTYILDLSLQNVSKFGEFI